MKLNESGQRVAQKLADMPEVQKLATPPAFKMTQDHYGHYASVIQQLSHSIAEDGQRRAGDVIAAEALKLAGGNKKGIDAAMSAMFGYSEYDALSAMLR